MAKVFKSTKFKEICFSFDKSSEQPNKKMQGNKLTENSRKIGYARKTTNTQSV